MPKVRVNNIHIYFEAHGEGPPFLWIMGGGSTSKDWPKSMLDYFSKHFTVIIFDNRGTGQTTVTENGYTMRQMAEDTAGLIEALGYPKVHVLGLSMGGMIAQELTINHPDKVDKLVLSCTHCGGPNHIQQPKDIQEKWRLTYDPPPEMTEEEIHKARISVLYASKFLEENYGRILNARFPSELDPPPLHVRKGQRKGMDEIHDTYDRLPLIQSSTLIMHGEEDKVVPVENGYLLNERIPDSRIVIFPDTGHLFSESGGGFFVKLMDFLKEDPFPRNHQDADSHENKN